MLLVLKKGIQQLKRWWDRLKKNWRLRCLLQDPGSSLSGSLVFCFVLFSLLMEGRIWGQGNSKEAALTTSKLEYFASYTGLQFAFAFTFIFAFWHCFQNVQLKYTAKRFCSYISSTAMTGPSFKPTSWVLRKPFCVLTAFSCFYLLTFD